MLTAVDTVHVRMADAGDLYISWRWFPDGANGMAIVAEDDVRQAVSRLTAALPRPGAMPAALTDGPFADYDAELALGTELAQTLLPEQLSREIRTRVRPHVRIQPAPRVAQVPWELLALADDTRVLDVADVSLLAPAGLVHGTRRTQRPYDPKLPTVRVIDPRVPGFAANSALGSVLGRLPSDSPLHPTRRTDTDRDWLSRQLRSGASSLLYVGHVTAAAVESGASETAQMHLCCGAAAAGFAPVLRGHRPLSAQDLLLGTHGLDTEPVAGPDKWPIPSRVALIACESGGDLRFGEALGLVAAMIHGGAQLVTATRWALPTDAAFALAGATGCPLHDAVCAVEAAHREPDDPDIRTPAPVSALCTWQRARLDAWRHTRAVAASPLLWAAFATIATAPTSAAT